jgi:hypothetical protein
VPPRRLSEGAYDLAEQILRENHPEVARRLGEVLERTAGAGDDEAAKAALVRVMGEEPAFADALAIARARLWRQQ